MTEFVTAHSSKKVKIGIASFEASMDLKDAIFTEMANAGIKIDATKLDINNMDFDVGQLAAAALKVDSSKLVRKALFDCLIKSTYDKEKITTATFEDPAARADYYEIAFACIKENLAPFFSGLLLGLKAMGIERLVKSNQTSK